jgi:hypothetical protein
LCFIGIFGSEKLLLWWIFGGVGWWCVAITALLGWIVMDNWSNYGLSVVAIYFKMRLVYVVVGGFVTDVWWLECGGYSVGVEDE